MILETFLPHRKTNVNTSTQARNRVLRGNVWQFRAAGGWSVRSEKRSVGRWGQRVSRLIMAGLMDSHCGELLVLSRVYLPCCVEGLFRSPRREAGDQLVGCWGTLNYRWWHPDKLCLMWERWTISYTAFAFLSISGAGIEHTCYNGCRNQTVPVWVLAPLSTDSVTCVNSSASQCLSFLLHEIGMTVIKDNIY